MPERGVKSSRAVWCIAISSPGDGKGSTSGRSGSAQPPAHWGGWGFDAARSWCRTTTTCNRACPASSSPCWRTCSSTAPKAATPSASLRIARSPTLRASSCAFQMTQAAFLHTLPVQTSIPAEALVPATRISTTGTSRSVSRTPSGLRIMQATGRCSRVSSRLDRVIAPSASVRRPATSSSWEALVTIGRSIPMARGTRVASGRAVPMATASSRRTAPSWRSPSRPWSLAVLPAATASPAPAFRRRKETARRPTSTPCTADLERSRDFYRGNRQAMRVECIGEGVA